MGFFSGPSTSILNKIALGYVGSLMEYRVISNMDIPINEKAELLKKSGLPHHQEYLTLGVVMEVS